jgi:glycosyltransferase involved in cell wall biosynthesis
LLTYQPLTTKAKGKKYETREDIEIYRVSWFGRGWFQKFERYFLLVFFYLFPGLFLKSIILYIKRYKEIGVIHAHGFIAAAVAKTLKTIISRPCVVSTHAIYNLKQRRILAFLVKYLLRDFDIILAVGEPSKKELVDIGLDGKKIKTHANWVDTEFFKPLNRDECRKAFGLESTDFVILFLGRLIEIKGLLILLDVAKNTNKDMKFVFAGDGHLARLIQDTAKTNNKIRYYGKLTDDQIIKAYNAADIFVSPVLYEEGYATVYLESLACGTPVITAKRGCLPYFLTSEVADLLEIINAETILKILNYYFENRKILNDKRKLCRKYAEQHFSEENAEVILSSY